MKKRPFHRYTKETGAKMILGTMACESMRRLGAYLQSGCNGFHKKEPTSQPLSFWLETDILQYLKLTGIPYASVYGNIVEDGGRLRTDGCARTGCMFCMFGVHLEKRPNRFQRMELTHPKLYDYCINQLGCGAVLDYIGVPYRAGDRKRGDDSI
jgi:3'-phosphoadenosine 5'-phosphosulfate sulfotransferase (PAPS reductase)/FAD synthetase